MNEFSFRTRKENLQKLKTEIFDILVIGGGINGAGVVRDAALRGLKVALIEADDFAVGTSSRSSKLVHGGIRYLENFEFHLVFEALSERAKLFKIAPHLVHPLRFMIPLFKNSRVGRFKMALGMMLYDLLALFRTPQMHENLNRNETLSRMPILRNGDLLGSSVYSDAYMDDDRLVYETLRSANESSACIINFCKIQKVIFENNKVKQVEVIDKKSGEVFLVNCDHIISSVGPWTDIVGSDLLPDWKKILRPTKGVHLTLARERLDLTSAVVMGAQQGNRIVFAIPRHEMIIIGTTDTDFSGNPTDVVVTKDDIEYLLQITNEYFPNARITKKDILCCYAGVRPLVKDESSSEGKTSREHTILSDPRGVIFVAGGKYTTYRLMAEQIIDAFFKNQTKFKKSSFSKCQTANPLNPYVAIEELNKAQNKIKNDLEKKLVFRYGAEAYEILKKWPNKTYWQLEALQAIHTTMCLDLTNFFARRTPLINAEKNHGLNYLDEVASTFQTELGWSDAHLQQEKESLKKYIDNLMVWKNQIN